MNKPPQNQHDRVIADSGWGIKPDDQPANAEENPSGHTFAYDPKRPNVIREILQVQRQGFNKANRVVVEPGRMRVIDLNGDALVIEGLGFGDPILIELLKALGATFDPKKLQQLDGDFKGTREYALSRVWAWGAERTG